MQTMHGREEQRVDLTESVPVYLVYCTAWVEEKGTFSSWDYVYGHDQTLSQNFYENLISLNLM